MKKEVVAYTRQSLHKQERESSTTSQCAAIEAYAKEKGKMIASYITDTGTGKHMDRKGMQELIEKIQSGQVDTVIVWRIDRISRKTEDLLNFLNLCEMHEVTVESVNDNVLSSHNAMDKFKMQTLAIIAELQRNIISENKENGLRAKFKKGQPISTAAPFGYRYQDGRFHIVPEEAETVRAVFELYLEGKGYKKISQITKSRTDLIFRSPQQVRYILKNEKSTGNYVGKYGRIDNSIIPIITQEIFEAAEILRLSKQKKASHSAPAKLKRKIPCPLCGRTMTTYYNRKQANSTAFYVCSTRMQEQYHDCEMPAIPIKKIEHQVLQSVILFITSKEQLTTLHDEVQNRLKEKQNIQQKHSIQMHRQRETLISDLANGKINMDEFKMRMATLNTGNDTDNETLNLNAVTLEKIIRLIKTHPDVKTTIWPFIKSVKVTRDGALEGVYIKGFKNNILKYSMKEQIMDEYSNKQAAD